MRSAIINWVAPLIVVEVDPREFDGPDFDTLLMKLEQHFMRSVVVITPDWEADCGIRIKGFDGRPELLADTDIVWRDLELVLETEIPF